jgi:Amt family ammonium transporter
LKKWELLDRTMMQPVDPSLWLFISTILLMVAIVGVALFYGGMVRSKNALNTMGMLFAAVLVVSIEWLFLGDWLVYGNGGFEESELSAGARSLLPLFHAMTAALGLGLVAGGIVERVRFLFFLVFGLLWTLLVYGPIALWLWGGGWLTKLGCLDFSGGAVVHITAGVTALIAAIQIGPRRGYGRTEMMPHHLPLSFLGVGLMWVGWFGFSSGAGRAPMTVVTNACVTIQMACVAAALSWMAVEWVQRDKPTALGMASGAVAGLVAITPAAGYVGPLSAMVIGIGAGGLCYMVVNYVKLILGYDDALDVFGMHGVGGTWGMIATGLFASTQTNADGSDGLFFGYPYQFFAQLVATVAVSAFAAVMSFFLLKGLTVLLPARVDSDSESMGLDLAQHGEKGYS